MMRTEKTTSSKNEQLRAFVDRTIESEKIRHPLRCTLRWLNILTRRIGIPAGGGWKKLDAYDSGTDTKLLMDVLWRSYWPALPDIASLHENGLESFDQLEEENHYIESPQLESGPPEYTQPVLMLPPPSGPEFIPEVEAEIVPPEPLPTVDMEESAREAEEAANQALSIFQGDHPRWEEPSLILKDLEATLVAVSPYHPDKESLYERLTFVRECHYYLDEFKEDFEHLMNSSQNPDDIWGVPWLARGAQDLFEQQLMPTPGNLYRASLPHYLVERWNTAVTGDGAPKGGDHGYSPDSPEANDIPSKPFRGPATETDSGF